MATSARRIRVPNPDLSKSERSQLDADYTGGVSLTVISNFGFQDNDIAVIGEPGTEKSEASDVTGTTGDTTVTISSALKFNHQSGTPVYRSEYDQIEFSLNTGGGWSVLDTVGIKWDDEETIKVHQGGTDNTSYRFRFKNSVSDNTSEYSPTITGSGYSKSSIGYLVRDVRSTINDPQRKIVSDEEIIRFLVRAKDIIRARRDDWWFWLKEDEGTITTVASQRKYDLDDISTRIEYVKNIRFRDASLTPVEIYHLQHLGDVEFDNLVKDESEATDDHLAYYNIMPPDSSSTSGYFRVDPAPENTGNGSFYIRHYEPDADYDDVADTTDIPIPQILSDFAIAQCEKLKGNDERAAFYESLFYGPAESRKDSSQLTGIALLEKMQVNKGKPTGQPRSIKRFLGRGAVRSLYRARLSTNRDKLVENFFNPNP